MRTDRAKTPAKVSWQAIGTIAFEYSEISVEIANNKFVVLRGGKWLDLKAVERQTRKVLPHRYPHHQQRGHEGSCFHRTTIAGD